MSNRTGKSHLSYDLSGRKKIVVGCIGGLFAAIGGSLLTVEPGAASDSTLPLVWGLGQALKILLFVAVGGFWVWLNTSEKNRMSVFQSGMVAPAMLSAMLAAAFPTNAGAASEASSISPEPASSITDFGVHTIPVSTASLFYVGEELYADEKDKSVVKCLWDGFVGRKC
jgi:hypothetical protein